MASPSPRLFKLGHMRKDVAHFLREAEGLGFTAEVAAKAQEAYLEPNARGTEKTTSRQ